MLVSSLTKPMVSALAISVMGGGAVQSAEQQLDNALEEERDSGDLVAQHDYTDITSYFKDDGTGNPSVGETLDGCTILDSSQFGGKTAAQWIAGLAELLSNTSMTVSGVENDTDTEEFIVASGETYRVEVQWSSKTASGHARVRNSFAGAGSVIQDTGNDTVVDTETYVFEATSSGTWHVELLLRGTGGISATVSVKHLPGNHTVASGTGPTLLDEFNQNDPALTDNGGRGDELVENGSNLTDTTSWTSGGGSTLSAVGGSLRVQRGADSWGRADQTISGLEVGAEYEIAATVQRSASFTYGLNIVTVQDTYISADGPQSVKFRAAATSHSFQATFQGASGSSGDYFDITVSVKRISTAFDERGAELVDVATNIDDSGGGFTINGTSVDVTTSGGWLQFDSDVLTIGETYEVVIKVTNYTQGQIASHSSAIEGSSGVNLASDGTLRVVGTAAHARYIAFCFSSPIFTLTSISVKQVIYPNLVTNPTDAVFDGTAGVNEDYTITVSDHAWHRFAFHVSGTFGGSNGSFTARFGTTGNTIAQISTTGWQVFYLRAPAGSSLVRFRNALANDFVGTISGISVQEVPASIARLYYTETNGTDDALTMALPARRNLLTYTGDFSKAAWSKTSVTGDGGGLREMAATGEHLFEQVVSESGSVTGSVEVQSVGRDVIRLSLGTSSGTYGVIYTFSTNAFSAVGSAITASSEVLNDGYVKITLVSSAGANRFRVQSTDGGASSFAGDPSKGVNVRNPQLETGSTATDYQSIGSDWMDDMMGSIAFRTSDTQGMLVNGSTVSYAAGIFTSTANASATTATISAPSYRVNGASASVSNRGDLGSFITDGEWCIVTMAGLDVSSFVEIVLGFYSTSHALNTAYDIVGLVIAPNTAENIELAEAALAKAMEPVGYALAA